MFTSLVSTKGHFSLGCGWILSILKKNYLTLRKFDVSAKVMGSNCSHFVTLLCSIVIKLDIIRQLVTDPVCSMRSRVQCFVNIHFQVRRIVMSPVKDPEVELVIVMFIVPLVVNVSLLKECALLFN